MYLEFRDRPDDEGPAEEVARMLAKDKASIGSRTVMENLDYLRTDLRFFLCSFCSQGFGLRPCTVGCAT